MFDTVTTAEYPIFTSLASGGTTDNYNIDVFPTTSPFGADFGPLPTFTVPFMPQSTFPALGTQTTDYVEVPINCEKYDIVFLPQNSNSVRWSNFEQFMHDFSRKLWINNEASRVAIVPFGRKPTSDDIINFIDYSTKTELLEKIRATGKSSIRGHFIEKGLKYISNEMLVAGDFRQDAKLIVIVIITSRTKSDDTEIRDAIAGLGRMRTLNSGVQIWILHSSEVPDDQLSALQHQNAGFNNNILHYKYDIGPNLDTRNGQRPLAKLNKILRDEIIEKLNACVDPDVVEVTTPMIELATTPMIIDEVSTPDEPFFPETTMPVFTTMPDDGMDAMNEMFATTMEMISSMFTTQTGTLSIPPPPPPIGPPPLPPRLQKVLLETAIPTEEPATTYQTQQNQQTSSTLTQTGSIEPSDCKSNTPLIMQKFIFHNRSCYDL